MRILIVNTHSIQNSGDAAIVIAQIQLLRNLFPNLKLSMTSRTPKLDKEFYNSLGIRIFPSIIPAPSVFSKSSQKFSQTVKYLLDIKSKNDLIKEIKQSDLIIGSGGGYFWSHRKILPGPMFFQNYFHIKLAAQLKKPIILFPQSFGNIRNKVGSILLQKLLEDDRMVGIFAREKTSLEFLKTLLRKNKNRLHYCPDMAFVLEREDRVPDLDFRHDLPRPIIAMTLRQWDFPGADNHKERKIMQNKYLETLRKLTEKIFKIWKGSVLVFCQSRGPGRFEDDRIISQEFMECIKRTVPLNNLKYIDFQGIVHPQSIINIVQKTDLLISTRFHSAIFALVTGVPVISISYQPKSKGIMEDLGLERYCLDISDFNSDEVFHLTEEILNRSDTLKREIQNKISQIRKANKIQLEKSLLNYSLHNQ